MASFSSNIFSRASGSIGGTTFLQARTRSGKVQTARQRVSPTNRKTAPQMKARDNLKDSVSIARSIIEFHGNHLFENAVSKLPSYQSLVSIYQKAKVVDLTDIKVVKTPFWIPRNNLPRPAAFNIQTPSPGIFSLFLERPEGGMPPNTKHGFGFIVKDMARSDMGGLRVYNRYLSQQPPYHLLINMASYPGSSSGVLYFAYIYTDVPFAEREYSEIIFNQST